MVLSNSFPPPLYNSFHSIPLILHGHPTTSATYLIYRLKLLNLLSHDLTVNLQQRDPVILMLDSQLKYLYK